MAQEYTVARVSTAPPREYYNEKFKTTTYYIKVMLEGHEKPVTIGKRSPDALKEGSTVYGSILPTEHDTDNFKSEPMQAAQTTPRSQSQPNLFDNKLRDRSMYTSYAKDLAIAVIESTPAGQEFDRPKYDLIVNVVAEAGDTLFDHATLGFKINKEIEEGINGKARIDSVMGKTERLAENVDLFDQ